MIKLKNFGAKFSSRNNKYFWN